MLKPIAFIDNCRLRGFFKITIASRVEPKAKYRNILKRLKSAYGSEQGAGYSAVYLVLNVCGPGTALGNFWLSFENLRSISAITDNAHSE